MLRWSLLCLATSRRHDTHSHPPPAPQALAILFAVSQYCQKHGIKTDLADGISVLDLLTTVVDDNDQQVCHPPPAASA